MRPDVVTDRVVWCVGLSACRSVRRSVCHSREMYKTAEPIEMSFGMLSRVDPRNDALDRVQIPCGKGKCWGGGHTPTIPTTL